jgi:hypothetical protein
VKLALGNCISHMRLWKIACRGYGIKPMFANTSINYIFFAHMLLPELRGGHFLKAITRATWSSITPPLLGFLSPLVCTPLARKRRVPTTQDIDLMQGGLNPRPELGSHGNSKVELPLPIGTILKWVTFLALDIRLHLTTYSPQSHWRYPNGLDIFNQPCGET